MALSEKANRALKGQADELIAEIKRIEEPIVNLITERDSLQKKIDEIQETSRDLKEAANVLMDLCDEEKPYDIPKKKEVVDYRKPGRLRVKKVCDACGETVYVPNPKKKCPLDGCKGKVEKPERAPDPDPEPEPEDHLESDDDIATDPPDDEEPKRSDPPIPVDESWRRPGEGTIKKGCNRCNRAVHVLPHCTICPDEMCRGHLVNAKKIKRKGPMIDDALKERVFGAIRSGCGEIRPEGLTMTEINAMAKTGHDRAFYATKALVVEGRVSLAKCRIDGMGREINVYRTTEHLQLTEDGDPPDPEPEPVAKKKKTKKPRALSSAARIKLIRSRHKTLQEDKSKRERRMDRMLGPQADKEDWSEE